MDEITMRLLDAMMAVPIILLYMIIMAALGASAINVVLAMTIVGTPGIARLVRSLTLDIRTREYIRAAETRGESDWYIMFTEILAQRPRADYRRRHAAGRLCHFRHGNPRVSGVRHPAAIAGLGLHGGQGPGVHPRGQPLGRPVAIIGYRLAGGGLEPAGRRPSRGIDAISIAPKRKAAIRRPYAVQADQDSGLITHTIMRVYSWTNWKTKNLKLFSTSST
jgi:hypothetical protein